VRTSFSKILSFVSLLSKLFSGAKIKYSCSYRLQSLSVFCHLSCPDGETYHMLFEQKQFPVLTTVYYFSSLTFLLRSAQGELLCPVFVCCAVPSINIFTSSSHKPLIGFGPDSTGMIPGRSSTIVVQTVLVGCISRSQVLKMFFKMQFSTVIT